MGDMADYALEQVFEFEELQFRYRNGKMFCYEAYDAGIIDELGYEYTPHITKTKTCRHCGAANLVWKHTQRGWRLHSGNDIHECIQYLEAELRGT